MATIYTHYNLHVGKLFKLTKRGRFHFDISPTWRSMQRGIFMFIELNPTDGTWPANVTMLAPNGKNLIMTEREFQTDYEPVV